MTPKEVRELSVSAYKGKYGPGKQHPEQLLRAGSILTFEGTDFAIPPLYPKGGVTIIPTFEDDDVALDVSIDESIVDVELVKLATSIRDKITINDDNLVIDPVKDVEVIKMLFIYARKCLLYLYDLSNEQLTELLRFGNKEIPTWVTQVIDHIAQQPAD